MKESYLSKHMNGLKLQSFRLLQVVFSSSTSSQIPSFRYPSTYKTLSLLWKNNYTFDYFYNLQKNSKHNLLTCNHPKRGAAVAAA